MKRLQLFLFVCFYNMILAVNCIVSLLTLAEYGVAKQMKATRSSHLSLVIDIFIKCPYSLSLVSVSLDSSNVDNISQ